MSEATHISQDGMRLSIHSFQPGSEDAAILVRASLMTPSGLSVQTGFDLNADSADQMARALARYATELRCAVKGLTVLEYAADQL